MIHREYEQHHHHTKESEPVHCGKEPPSILCFASLQQFWHHLMHLIVHHYESHLA